MTKYAMSLGLRSVYAPSLAERYIRPRAKGRIFVVSALIAAALFYVFAVNYTAVQGYRIRELESYVEELRLQNQKVELELTSEQSLPYVAAQVGGKGFVSAGRVQYIKATVPAVALK